MCCTPSRTAPPSKPDSSRLGSLTLDNYVQVLTQPSGLRPFIVSVVYSALAAVIAVGGLLFVARLLQKYKNWVGVSFEYLLHIPWILPSALLALGLIISYDHPNPLVGGAVLTGTTVILLIAFVTVKIPFTLRMLKASFASVNSSLEEAAAIMGAKTLYVFRRILLPLVLPAAAAIAALNFNSMLDDYDTAIFLAHPLVQPLGLVIKANTDGAEGRRGRGEHLCVHRAADGHHRGDHVPRLRPVRATRATGSGLPAVPPSGASMPADVPPASPDSSVRADSGSLPRPVRLTRRAAGQPGRTAADGGARGSAVGPGRAAGPGAAGHVRERDAAHRRGRQAQGAGPEPALPVVGAERLGSGQVLRRSASVTASTSDSQAPRPRVGVMACAASPISTARPRT